MSERARRYYNHVIAIDKDLMPPIAEEMMLVEDALAELPISRPNTCSAQVESDYLHIIGECHQVLDGDDSMWYRTIRYQMDRWWDEGVEAAKVEVIVQDIAPERAQDLIGTTQYYMFYRTGTSFDGGTYLFRPLTLSKTDITEELAQGDNWPDVVEHPITAYDAGLVFDLLLDAAYANEQIIDKY